MALFHEKLYQSKNLALIDYSEFINGLVNSISETYAWNSNPVTIKVDAANIFLNIDTAIPFGLIINELVTNSLK